MTVQTALSKISEDSYRPSVLHKCLNITGIDKYPQLHPILPRAWSVPALAPHIRANLEAPLVSCNINYYLQKSIANFIYIFIYYF